MNNKRLDSYIRQTYADAPFNPDMNRRMLGTTILMSQLKQVPGESFKVMMHGRELAVPDHGHDFFEMMYVYDGSITQLIDGDRITLDKGAVCIVDTKVTHAIEDTKAGDLAINFVMHKEFFSHTFFSQLTGNSLFSEFLTNALYRHNTFGRYLVFHTGDDEHVRSLVMSVMNEYFDPDICSSAAINSLMPLLFNRLFRVWRNRGGKKILHDADSGLNIWAILRYIDTNFKTATLKSTAARFGYSPSYLSTLLTKTTGYSFTDLKHDICMNQAAFLLSNTDMIISDVAQSVGFSNMSFFYSLFNRKFNTTPAEYRFQNRQTSERNS